MFLVEQNAYHALKLAHRGYVMVNGADHHVRHRPRASCARGSEGRLSGRRPLNGRSARAAVEFMDLIAEKSFTAFLLVTVVLGGGAAFMAGRALASSLEAFRARGHSTCCCSALQYASCIGACSWTRPLRAGAQMQGTLLSLALLPRRYADPDRRGGARLPAGARPADDDAIWLDIRENQPADMEKAHRTGALRLCALIGARRLTRLAC